MSSTLFLKIKIIGTEVSLFLANKNGEIADKLKWTDNRDLSEKLLKKIDKLLKRNNLTIKDISRSDFYCDSPYFRLEGDTPTCRLPSINGGCLEKSSKGKCGFMSWQIGEITAKVLNLKTRG